MCGVSSGDHLVGHRGAVLVEAVGDQDDGSPSLEALQELARLAVQAKTGERSRLMLDVAGYRAGRRRALEDVAARAVAEEYPDIEFQDRIVDNCSMQLVTRPEEYDVLVLPNLYGDILSDIGAGLVGGLGVAPGANFGDDVAVFEPTHGSAPKYAGLNKINPMAMMLSGVLMLRHLGEDEAAVRLEAAIATVIAEGTSVTWDMKPSRTDPTAVGTSDVADAVLAAMR